MSQLVQTKEKVGQPKTKRQATRGKIVRLHKYWKGVAALNHTDPQKRRHYLNMMLDATVSEIEEKNKRRKGKEESTDE